MYNLYKQDLPNRTYQEHSLDVLRLSEEQYKEFQDVARKWYDVPPKHTKLLPRSLETIRDSDKHTLCALMGIEEAHHNDKKSNFHRGGGLVETGRSIFGALWRLTPIGMATHWVSDHFDISHKPTKMSEQDYMYADIVDESYDTARDKTLKGQHYVSSLSDEKIAVYVDRENETVNLGIRGTKMNMKDLMSDLNIVAGNKSGHEQEIAERLTEIIGNFDTDYRFSVSAHSLGGLEAMNIFMGDLNPQLERVDRVNLFNPGLSPTHNLDTAKAAVNDERFNFYLNSGDIISNGFGSLVNEDTNVHWGKANINPLSNHSLEQWTDEDI